MYRPSSYSSSINYGQVPPAAAAAKPVSLSRKYKHVCDCRGPPQMSIIMGLWYNTQDHSFCIECPLYYTSNGDSMSPTDEKLDRAKRVSYLDLVRGSTEYGGDTWTFNAHPTQAFPFHITTHIVEAKRPPL